MFLPKTVLLETEWVLRRLYRLDRVAVIHALQALVSLPAVRCEDEPAVLQALRWRQEGLDFADALHPASSRTVGRFATFDRALIKLAAANSPGVPVSHPDLRHLLKPVDGGKLLG